MQHRGFRHIWSGVKIGKNCEMLPLVLIGKKTNITDCNVTIAAGAVVTKDVTNNSVVGGILAKVLKIKKND